MATLAASSSSSPRCVPFAFRRGGERRTRAMPAPGAPGSSSGCGRPLCRAAEAVGGGIRGAFFASLDRCSCVEVRTKHDDSFRMVDAAPLMRDGAAASGDESAAAGCGCRRASAGKGNTKQRHGLGYCAAKNSTTGIN